MKHPRSIPASRLLSVYASNALVSNRDEASEGCARFAARANDLHVHMPVAEVTQYFGRKLHAPPGIIGNIAARKKTKTLVQSHIVARKPHNLEQNPDRKMRLYSEPVASASDLELFGL